MQVKLYLPKVQNTEISLGYLQGMLPHSSWILQLNDGKVLLRCFPLHCFLYHNPVPTFLKTLLYYCFYFCLLGVMKLNIGFVTVTCIFLANNLINFECLIENLCKNCLLGKPGVCCIIQNIQSTEQSGRGFYTSYTFIFCQFKHYVS